MVRKQSSYTEREREEIYNRWHKGGLSKREYCLRYKINYHTFQYWCSMYNRYGRFSSPGKKAVAAPTSFIELQPPVADHIASVQSIEIHYPGGITVHLPASISADYIKSLLSL